jgi:thymidylate synthase (FAD)
MKLRVNREALLEACQSTGAALPNRAVREVFACKLANRLLDLLQKESPNLFGDYQRVDLGDGTFEIVTQYRKV